MDRESLLSEIHAAFAAVPRGNGITLHEADVIDDYGSDEERAAARLLDTDATWRGVRPEWIERLTTAPCYLDDDGFCYYLPAFMCWSVEFGPDSDYGTADIFLIQLDDPGRQELLVRSSDKRQLRAVALFVEWMLCNYWVPPDAQSRSLSAYWGQYR
jgi:hypothetical protein